MMEKTEAAVETAAGPIESFSGQQIRNAEGNS